MPENTTFKRRRSNKNFEFHIPHFAFRNLAKVLLEYRLSQTAVSREYWAGICGQRILTIDKRRTLFVHEYLHKIATDPFSETINRQEKYEYSVSIFTIFFGEFKFSMGENFLLFRRY